MPEEFVQEVEWCDTKRISRKTFNIIHGHLDCLFDLPELEKPRKSTERDRYIGRRVQVMDVFGERVTYNVTDFWRDAEYPSLQENPTRMKVEYVGDLDGSVERRIPCNDSVETVGNHQEAI